MKVVSKLDFGGTDSHAKIFKGHVYNVRSKIVCPLVRRPGFRLVEIVNPINEFWGEEYAYDCDFFERVIETDISIFTSMLVTPPKEKVAENA